MANILRYLFAKLIWRITGYAIAPPSVHEEGHVYHWEPGLSPDEVPFAPVPAWLLQLTPRGPRTAAAGFWADSSNIVTCKRPCIEKLRHQKIPVGERNQCAVIWARDLRRQYCQHYSGEELKNRILSGVVAAYRPSALPNEDWEKELRHVVKCIVRTDAGPHPCDHPFLRRYCVGANRCPYVEALRDRAESCADLSGMPDGLTGTDAGIYSAIIKIEARYSREPGDWVVTCQSDIAKRAGFVSRWTVNTRLPQMADRGYIEVATQRRLARLIASGEVNIGKPSGTAIRRDLTHSRSKEVKEVRNLCR